MKVLIFIITMLSCELISKAGKPHAVKTHIKPYSEQDLKRIVAAAETRHNLPKGLLERIIAHESKWKINAVNKRTLDYGLGQINHRTAKSLGLDIARLTVDPEYNIEHSARILKSFKRSHGHETTWACRYNIGYRNVAAEPYKSKCLHYLNQISK